MEIDLFTFIAQLINFSILVYLLNMFLFKRITKAMDERQARIAGDIADARTKSSEAAEAARQNMLAGEKLRAEAGAMLDRARAAADMAKEGYMAASRAEAEAARVAWFKELDAQKESYLDSLRSRSGEFMILAAEKALHDLANEKLFRRISEVFLEKLGSMPENKAEDIREKIAASREALFVRSSFEIDAGIKEGIGGILKNRYGYGGRLGFGITPEVCGVELVIGGYRVSWCVKDYLMELEDELKKVWKNGE